MSRGKLKNNEAHAITRNGGQSDYDQDQTDAIATGRVRKHADMITSFSRSRQMKGEARMRVE